MKLIRSKKSEKVGEVPAPTPIPTKEKEEVGDIKQEPTGSLFYVYLGKKEGYFTTESAFEAITLSKVLKIEDKLNKAIEE